MHFTSKSFAALVAIPLAAAQTFTDCNPLEKTCPADTGLQSSSFYTDFTQGAGTSWTPAAGTTLTYGSQGAVFTIVKDKQGPTISTDFAMLFGRIEVKMTAAPGQGIVSSIVLESDDLDEIDWEFLGANTAQVESNYFGKGDTTTYDRAIYHSVSAPQTTSHVYTVDWTSERLIFYIDGTQVRQLNYADAQGGTRYPQTPMKLKLGNWVAGGPDSPNGTVEWAGGYTDFSKAPFNMYVEYVKIDNYTPAKQYVWSDNSGSYGSIKAVQGDGSSSSASGTVSATSATASSKGSASTSGSSTMSSTKTSDSDSVQTSDTPSEITAGPVKDNGLAAGNVTMTTSTTSTAKSGSSASSASTSASSTKASATATSSGAQSNAAATGITMLFTVAMCFMML